jgi:hypothetical protein
LFYLPKHALLLLLDPVLLVKGRRRRLLLLLLLLLPGWACHLRKCPLASLMRHLPASQLLS